MRNSRKLGDVVRINARGRVKEADPRTGKYVLELLELKDKTEDELVRMSEKDGILDDNDLALVFGEDQ